MSDIGKAYVQIVPKAQGISGQISNIIAPGSAKAGKEAGASAGSNMADALKKTLAGLAIGATVTSVFKSALDEGAKLQQSYGGLETIYGEAAGAAKEYAAQAAAAGISANTYAETAVGMGASLKAAFEGDTTKAVEAANMAILDMTDNAAKMGTPIESIQNAYAGFAKGNYTMLDNLKLGYGGTKSEMERLLADATKLTGVKYDMDNLGDVYAAIHAIQGDLGLTGVAAAEASTTFSGSLDAMKAAAANLLGNLALGENIGPAMTTLVQSVMTFLTGNLLPMIGTVLASLPDAFGSAMQTAIPALQAQLPALISAGQSLVGGLLQGITAAVPQIMSGANHLVRQFLNAFVDFYSGGSEEVIGAGGAMISSLVQGAIASVSDVAIAAAEATTSFVQCVINILPEVIDAGMDIVGGLMQGIMDAIPNILEAGAELASNLIHSIAIHLPEIGTTGIDSVLEYVNGIIAGLPNITDAALQAFSTLLTSILNNAPQLLTAGIQLITRLVQGLLNSLPQIVASAVKIVAQLAQTIAQNLPQILQVGGQLIGQLLVGIVNAVPQILGTIPGILSQIGSSFLGYNWGSIGSNIISGIAGGLSGGVGAIVSAAKQAAQSALDAAKNLLGIKSPSRVFRDEVGKMMALGMAEGFEDNLPNIGINRAVTAMTDSASQTASRAPVVGGGTQTFNIYMTVDGAQDPTAWASQFAADLQRYARMA